MCTEEESLEAQFGTVIMVLMSRLNVHELSLERIV